MKRNFETMKRRFASPLLVPRDSPLGEAEVSGLSKAGRYSSQPEMRRFTSPFVDKRAPASSSGSVSKDQSMEPPKTPKRCLRAESATRTVTRRLFHASERYSQLNELLSAVSVRRTPPRPPVFDKADKRGTDEVLEFSKPGPDSVQRQARSILRQSTDSQPDTRENLARGSNAPQIHQPNNTDVSEKQSAGRDEKYPQPCRSFSVSKGRASTSDTKQPSVVGNHQPVRQTGNLSKLLLKSETARTKMCSSGGNHDDSPPFITSPRSAMKLASDKVWSLEDFSCPLVTDTANLTCNGASLLDTMIECRFLGAHAKIATSPTRSGQESEQMNDCAKKLKMLLVPRFLPFAELVQQNCTPNSVIQALTNLYVVQPSNQLSRDRIRDNAKSFEAVHPDILVDDKKENECVKYSFVKTTKSLKQVSGEKYLHLRLPPRLQERTSNHLQMIYHHSTSDKYNHTVLISPQKIAKGCVRIACTQSSKERLSPSSRYAAQSLEFRSISSSKRLQMAEIAVECLTQNEFLFSTLV